jgi:Fur family ferric uptake transcriptional regulator
MPRYNTKAQSTILDLLQNESNALSHEDIMARAGNDMDRVTVYRILNRFVERGLAHRIVADDGRQYFASCQEGCDHAAEVHEHAHFRCTVCNTVECVPGDIDVNLPMGYSVDNCNIILSGSCQTCADQA